MEFLGRTILFAKVKVDQVDNWKAGLKEYAALVKKAGSDHGFTVWQSQSGPFQYAVVWYSNKWAEMQEDDPKMKSLAGERSAIFARLNGQTESLETWIDEVQPDLSIRSNQIPAMTRTNSIRVVPGKMEEFKALFRDQVMPAIKKGGATDYGFAVSRFGTPSNEVHTYLGLSGMGDLDAPLGAQKGMSEAEWKAFQAKFATLTEGTSWNLWRYQPDLSYLPPSTK